MDPLKRTRGRRGFDVLSRLQELANVEISERDFDDMPRGNVDARLVRLAQEINAKLVTNDYNLNRVAQVEGVVVLNVNELTNAVKPVVLPGEELHVAVIREGKEGHQGIGYLEDGTMIVVEHGRRLIGEETDVVVTSVLADRRRAHDLRETEARERRLVKWGAVVVAAGSGRRLGQTETVYRACRFAHGRLVHSNVCRDGRDRRNRHCDRTRVHRAHALARRTNSRRSCRIGSYAAAQRVKIAHGKRLRRSKRTATPRSCTTARAR